MPEPAFKSLTGTARKNFLEKYKFRPTATNCRPIVSEAIPLNMLPGMYPEKAKTFTPISYDQFYSVLDPLLLEAKKITRKTLNV